MYGICTCGVWYRCQMIAKHRCYLLSCSVLLLVGCEELSSDRGQNDAGGGGDLKGCCDHGGGSDQNAALDSLAPDGGKDSGQPQTIQTECVGWKSKHPTWLWCDDFEQTTDLNKSYPDTGLTGFGISTEDALSGTHSIRQRYTKSQVNAGWIFWFYSDALGKSYSQPQEEIYVRWFHKFEAGFTGVPPKMARLSSIGSGWNKRFAVHHWIDPSSYNIKADVHVPYSSQANSSGWLPAAKSTFSYKNQANIGRWICHEMYVKNNTSGQADGAYTFWADGKEIVKRTNVDLRGSTSYNFNAVQLDCYWNGGSPKEQSRFYDNLVISSERIGCAGL
jgi:hypothetical protein